MKCAEVVEWMHRYLDQDLSRDEIIELFRHIDNCPSCAEVYERLSILSEKLEQLPDVKAPFSLVDSILPQLKELDRAARDQSATRADEQIVVPFSDDKSRRKTSRGTSMASRTGIGAAAAAILLGIAIFNMPDKLPGAEVEQSLQKSAALSHNEVADSASQTQVEAEETTNELQQFTTTDSGTNANVSSGNDDAPEMDNDDTSTNMAVASDPTEEPIASPKTSSKPPESESRTVPAPTDKLKPKVTEPVQSLTQTPSTTPPEQSDNIDKEISNPDKGEGSDWDIASSLQVEDVINIPNAYEQGVMSLRSYDDSAVQTWTSPDNLYVAELTKQQLVIFSNPSEGSEERKIAVASYLLEGKWVSGKWSPDSMQFTYVIDLEGTYVTKVHDILQDKVISTPTPVPSPTATTEVSPVPTPTD